MNYKVFNFLLVACLSVNAMSVSESCREQTTRVVKENWPFVVIPGVVVGVYYGCNNEVVQEYIKSIHQEQIDTATQCVDALKGLCPKVALGIHNETELLQNVESVSLQQHEAYQLLEKFNAIQELVNDYNSWKPWKWTDGMQKAAHSMKLFLQQYGTYKSYFECHADCLKAWKLLYVYEQLVSTGLTDIQQIMQVSSQVCKCSGQYYLVETASCLRRDIEFVQQILLSEYFKATYVKTYEAMYELHSTLQMAVNQIERSSEYYSQYAKLHKR